MGRNIEDFIPYATITDQTVMSGPQAYVNDSTLFRAHTWAQAWSLRKSLKAAAEIKDFIILGKDNRATLINANHKFDPKANADATRYSTGWAVVANDNAFTDEELEFNEADRRAKYKDLYKTYVIAMHTDTADEMERLMWDDPHELMENPGPGDVRRPYSIPAIITSDGKAPSGFTSSTVLGIDPSVQTNWQNQFETFEDFPSEVEDRLFRAKMHSTWVDSPNIRGNVLTGTPLDRRMIFADLRSIEALRRILRDSNDRLTSLGQFDGKLTYDGIPIVWAELLGDVSIAPTDQRLFGVNFDFLFPIVRQNWFMKLLDAPYGGPWKPHNMPLSNAIYEFTYYNWWPRSRRRLFVIAHSSKTW